MQPVKEQLIEAIDDLEMDELVDLLEDCEEALYWWLEDLYPDAIDDEELRSMLVWLQRKAPKQFAAHVTEFVLSDCVLKPHVLDALGVVEEP